MPASTSAPQPGWRELVSEEGKQLLARATDAQAAGDDIPAIDRSFRKTGTDPALIAAVLTQLDLRAQAATKFGNRSACMLFTRAGLEQATRFPVATHHASRFAAAKIRSVADLGCGLGTESLALLEAGVRPLPVEIDPLTAAFAQHNLAHAAAEHQIPAPPVQVGDAEQFDLAAAEGAFLDPARRTAGHRETRRITDPGDYVPSLDFAFELAARLPTGIKLGPGFDRDRIPADFEAQWVSVDGQVVELGLWSRSLARPGVRRSALVLRGSAVAELTAAQDSPDAEPHAIQEYLYEPDGAVIRARLIGLLAAQLGGGMVHPRIAYLTSAHPFSTPFATTFRVREMLPARESQLRQALRARNIGRLEIKKRGVDVDPAALRRRLKLRGDESATLLLTRGHRDQHLALLVERVASAPEAIAPAPA